MLKVLADLRECVCVGIVIMSNMEVLDLISKLNNYYLNITGPKLGPLHTLSHLIFIYFLRNTVVILCLRKTDTQEVI